MTSKSLSSLVKQADRQLGLLDWRPAPKAAPVVVAPPPVVAKAPKAPKIKTEWITTYDTAIPNPALRPKQVAAFLVETLKARLGCGSHVDVIKGESTMPRGWAFGNYTVVQMTLPQSKKTIRAGISLHVGKDPDLASGSAHLDTPYGTITTLRDRSPYAFLRGLVSEICDTVGR
jgi:hypothetical protein